MVGAEAHASSNGKVGWPVVAAIGAAIIGGAYFFVLRPAKRGYEAQLQKTKQLAASLDGPEKRYVERDIARITRGK